MRRIHDVNSGGRVRHVVNVRRRRSMRSLDSRRGMRDVGHSRGGNRSVDRRRRRRLGYVSGRVKTDCVRCGSVLVLVLGSHGLGDSMDDVLSPGRASRDGRRAVVCRPALIQALAEEWIAVNAGRILTRTESTSSVGHGRVCSRTRATMGATMRSAGRTTVRTTVWVRGMIKDIFKAVFDVVFERRTELTLGDVLDLRLGLHLPQGSEDGDGDTRAETLHFDSS